MPDIGGRRQTLTLGIATAAALLARVEGAAAQAPGLPEIRGKTYVIVHGAWGGGYAWAPVAERLRAQGHRVFTPTQTGLGERKHLLSRDITVDTFVEDIANVLEAEDLRDVVLVGHSFGGIAVTGVADRMPERIRRLVYPDGVILQHGQSFLDSLPPEVAARMRAAVRDSGNGATIPVPPIEGLGALGIPPGPLAEWVHRRMTPHPFGTYETPLKLSNPVGNGRPCTYVYFTTPSFALTEPSRRWARGRDGWDWAELPAGHVAQFTAPEEVARLLAGIG